MATIPRFRIIPPALLTVTDGTIIGGGDVSDVQAWNDGNILHIQEVPGVPGYDVEFRFDNVNSFLYFAAHAYYEGSSTHYITIDLYNNDTASWDTMTTMDSVLSMHCFMPYVPIDTPYINGSNQVTARLYHLPSGNASHDLYVACIGLLY